ncbi:alpha/beta hydrolase [Brucepastera parasyntrophica]|uniref:alpha/beta hydrolase n=1 Tax=Brucepastera parasyntrophica TaxID=2880008 RepID=UPI003F6EEC3A
MQDNHPVYDAVSRFTNNRGSSTLTRGRLDILTFDMPQFGDNRKRKVRVWLPDNYRQEDTGTKYPVMYMHDAQNLFDAYTSFMGEWEVDESLGKMMDAGYSGAIVVGIDNGESLRFNELSPPWERNSMGATYIGDPAGNKYASFIIETVKPYIDGHYNTKSEARFTGIGGVQWAGLCRCIWR